MAASYVVVSSRASASHQKDVTLLIIRNVVLLIRKMFPLYVQRIMQIIIIAPIDKRLSTFFLSGK